MGVQKGGIVTEALLDRLIDSSIKRGDYKLVANIVSNIHDGRLLSAVFDRIGPILRDVKAAYAFEREWATALERLVHSSEIGSDKKDQYADQFGPILENFRRR